MKVSILIATVGHRYKKFLPLAEELTKQAYGLPVEIVAYWNNGEKDIGEIRQELLEDAKGEYVCFVDDDDWVPDYYIAEIMQNLGEDYVGFQVELFEGDEVMKPVYHSIKYGVWHEDDAGYYRGVTHLNPIKKELAVQGRFGRGVGEDESWARQVTPLVRTENYIKQIMYYYRHNMHETHFGGRDRQPEDWTRPPFSHPNFRWHPNSKTKGRS